MVSHEQTFKEEIWHCGLVRRYLYIMDESKQKQVYEILLMPIECDKYKYNGIYSEGSIIYSGQHYASRFSDADMSDLAVGYYEIVYKNLLGNNPILLTDGNILNPNFAGDTMNSFNTVANRVPGAGKSRDKRKLIPKSMWPDYLQEYELNYHCLANFWLLPMKLGRTLEPMSKAKAAMDYMDRFLKVYDANIKWYEEEYEYYFTKIGGFLDFAKIHFLIGNNVNENMQIEVYSTPIKDGKNFIRRAQEMMRHRADLISKSEYVDDLWKYFKEIDILKNP